MYRPTRYIGIGLLVSWLSGCSIQEETELTSAVPSNEVSSASSASTVIDDDGIAAPTAPTLSISATAGALNFKWFDKRTNAKAITSIKLFEYNSRTGQEIEPGTDIDVGDQRVTLPITPHRFAWNAVSYRVEICTNDNCVSSLRVPVRTLLGNSVTAATPSNNDLSPSFGDDLAINAHGNMAVVSSPIIASAAILLYNDQFWVQASTLESQHFSKATDAGMRVAVSASGDTIAIASVSSTASPVIVIFDRLGENWIETAVITPFKPLANAQHWDKASMGLQLSDNGDRLVFATQPMSPSVNNMDDTHNQILVYDRSTINWTPSATLTVPLQHTRLRSTSASGDINKVVALSVLNNSLYIHEFSLSNDQWRETSSQILDAIDPSIDTQIVSAQDAAQIGLAAWEPDSEARRSAVAWKFEKRTTGWIAVDSIRTPPTADQSARLRIASDARLQSLVVGWQAQTDANLAFYAEYDQHWQHQFSVPEDLNLNRTVPLAQSVVVSADNSTTLIGTTKTGSGGVVNSFR